MTTVEILLKEAVRYLVKQIIWKSKFIRPTERFVLDFLFRGEKVGRLHWIIHEPEKIHGF